MKATGTVSVFLMAALFAAACQKAPETPAASAPTTSASAAATPAAPATKAADTTGVPECDAYMAAVEKYLKCANVPQAARDAQSQAAKQMKASWASWATMPPDARKMAQDAAKSSCSQAMTALKQAASATGCPVD